MKIAFIVRRLDALRDTYTTTLLAHEAALRGHAVWMVRARDLLCDARSRVWGRATRPRAAAPELPRDFIGSLTGRSTERAALLLDEMDAVFLRVNPHLLDAAPDQRLGSDVLHIADVLRGHGVRVINDPGGLHRAGSKIYLTSFPEDVRPRTLVSCDATAIRRFLRSLDRPAILKPAAGFGGESVFYVRRGAVANVNPFITAIRRHGYVIAQEYLEGARRGDKRLLLWDGEPVEVGGQVAVYRRTHPKDDVRNNMHVGGRRSRTTLTPADRETVARIAPRLRADGLTLAGVDLVDGKVLEVNVDNPGGIHNINELYGINVAAAILDRLEAWAASRNASPGVSAAGA